MFDDDILHILSFLPLKSLLNYGTTARRMYELSRQYFATTPFVNLSEFRFSNDKIISKLKIFLLHANLPKLKLIKPDDVFCRLLRDEAFAFKFFGLHPDLILPRNYGGFRNLLQNFPSLEITYAEWDLEFLPALCRPNLVQELRIRSLAVTLPLKDLNFARVKTLLVEDWYFCWDHYQAKFQAIIQSCPNLEVLRVGRINFTFSDECLSNFDTFCQSSSTRPFRIQIVWNHTNFNSSDLTWLPNFVPFISTLRVATDNPIIDLNRMRCLDSLKCDRILPTNWLELNSSLKHLDAEADSSLIPFLKQKAADLESITLNCERLDSKELNNLVETIKINCCRLKLIDLVTKTCVTKSVREELVSIIFYFAAQLVEFRLDIALTVDEIVAFLKQAPNVTHLNAILVENDFLNVHESGLHCVFSEHPKLQFVNLYDECSDNIVRGCQLEK